MKNQKFFRTVTCLVSFILLSTVLCQAQKKKLDNKLDSRKYDIEIRDAMKEGKKYEKALLEFNAKNFKSEYLDTKIDMYTMPYKVTKDSTFTDDGDEMKYFEITVDSKNSKGEEIHCTAIASGKDISGKIEVMKGDVVKRKFEFEGTRNYD